jgi:prolyl-tRNA synthetase
VEIGPKEVQNRTVTLFRRDSRVRESCTEDNLVDTILRIGKDILNFVRKKAEDWLNRNIAKVSTKEELLSASKKGGFIKLNFCGRQECADEIKSGTGGVEVRGTLYGSDEKPKGKCAWCGKAANEVTYAAKSY